MDDFKSIVITPGKPVQIKSNPTKYPLIGKGLQGAVFMLSNDQCVKIYARKKYFIRESGVFRKVSGNTSILPEVYEIGPNYMIMEYLSGPSLEEHIKESGTIGIKTAEKIITLIKELERMNFPRIDFALRHCIFNRAGLLKIIDHVNSFKVKRSYPKRLLKDLKQLKLLPLFLKHVKHIDPNLFQKWQAVY